MSSVHSVALQLPALIRAGAVALIGAGDKPVVNFGKDVLMVRRSRLVHCGIWDIGVSFSNRQQYFIEC